MTSLKALVPELARLLEEGADRASLATTLDGVEGELRDALLDRMGDLDRPAWPRGLELAGLELLLDLAVRLDRGTWVGAALVEEAALPKPARKAIKRAAHTLRSRSIEVPVPLADDASASGRASSAARDTTRASGARAFLTFPDGTGHRLALLMIEESRGGHMCLQLILRDRSIVDMQVSFTTGRESRELVGKWRAGLAGRQGEVPPHWVVNEVLEAERGGRIVDSTLVPRLARLRPRISKLATEAAGPALPRIAPEELDAVRGAVPTLFEHGAFEAWIPDRTSLTEHAERLETVLSSDLVVSEAQRREQMAELGRRAIAAYLSEERRAELVHRLELSAALLFHLDERASAIVALAAAREVREDPAPRFVERMFERVFEGPHLPPTEAGAGVEAPRSSILLPGQEPEPPKGGGIIL